MGTGVHFSVGKVAGAWSWPLPSSCCQGQENVDLYIHSPTPLHGTVLKYLSTGTTLTFLPSVTWIRLTTNTRIHTPSVAVEGKLRHCNSCANVLCCVASSSRLCFRGHMLCLHWRLCPEQLPNTKEDVFVVWVDTGGHTATSDGPSRCYQRQGPYLSLSAWTRPFYFHSFL
jgi:hypothetical protein